MAGEFGRVIVTRNGVLIGEKPLASASFTIGRERQNHLVLEGVTVSRTHCRIEWRKDLVQIIDLGSSTGTFVNGRRTDRYPLKEGDVVRVGDYSLQWCGPYDGGPDLPVVVEEKPAEPSRLEARRIRLGDAPDEARDLEPFAKGTLAAEEALPPQEGASVAPSSSASAIPITSLGSDTLMPAFQPAPPPALGKSAEPTKLTPLAMPKNPKMAEGRIGVPSPNAAALRDDAPGPRPSSAPWRVVAMAAGILLIVAAFMPLATVHWSNAAYDFHLTRAALAVPIGLGIVALLLALLRLSVLCGAVGVVGAVPLVYLLMHWSTQLSSLWLDSTAPFKTLAPAIRKQVAEACVPGVGLWIALTACGLCVVSAVLGRRRRRAMAPDVLGQLV